MASGVRSSEVEEETDSQEVSRWWDRSWGYRGPEGETGEEDPGNDVPSPE